MDTSSRWCPTACTPQGTPNPCPTQRPSAEASRRLARHCVASSSPGRSLPDIIARGSSLMNPGSGFGDGLRCALIAGIARFM